MTYERIILGWNEDGSGETFRLCKVCGEYKPIKKFNGGCNTCNQCYNDRAREKKLAPPPSEDSCEHCKSFSRQKQIAHASVKGWCIRRRKSVFGTECCSDFKRPLNGKYQIEVTHIRRF